MKRQELFWAVLVLSVGITLAASPVQAQDPPVVESGLDLEAELEYGYGTVQEISAERLVLLENGQEEEADGVAVAYRVAADLELSGVESLGEIQPGDEADVEYVVENEERVAKYITVYPSE